MFLLKKKILALEISTQVKQCGICLILQEDKRISGYGAAKMKQVQRRWWQLKLGDWVHQGHYTLLLYLFGSLPDKKERNENKYLAKNLKVVATHLAEGQEKEWFSKQLRLIFLQNNLATWFKNVLKFYIFTFQNLLLTTKRKLSKIH